MKNILNYFFLITFLLATSLFSDEIDSTKKEQSILESSQIFIDTNSLSFEEVKSKAHFEQHKINHFNIGFTHEKVVWIRFTLKNSSKKDIERVLEVKNALLEKVTLYHEDTREVRGMLHIQDMQTNIQPAFDIKIAKNTPQTYYLEIKNNTTALRFGLFLKDKDIFLYQEHKQQSLILVFVGILILLILYNLLLYLYDKEVSYLHYSFYLLVILLQQVTYLGISPLFLPAPIVYIDDLSVLLKVNMMYISAAIFAKSFLQTDRYKKINKVYNLIIILALLEIPIFGTPWFYYPEVGVITGFVFILFNLLSGIYIYLKGYKQARLFVLGWSFLVLAFVIMIFDALGFISVMHKVPNLLMYATALEALVLSLAFTDRYIILRKEKEFSDKLLLTELQDRQTLIEQEIDRQTKELSNTLENKKVLLKELHHRTKNNLQLILSLVRMHSDSSKDLVKSKFDDLELRISAIAKTHQMLYLKDNLQNINIHEYIDELCSDMQRGIDDENLTLNIDIAEIYIPLKESSYIGLIVNELVTNSIKHSDVIDLVIDITMNFDADKYTLCVKDNGVGYDIGKNTKGIGLSLVKTIVLKQLDGKVDFNNDNGMSCMIEFKL